MIGNGAFSENQLTSVTIGNSVTSIGNYVFYQNRLTSVTIPNSVTLIGNGAFSENQLTSVTFQGSITGSNFHSMAFPEMGDLRAKYLTGGPGTYAMSSDTSDIGVLITGTTGLAFSHAASGCAVSVGTATTSEIVIPEICPQGHRVTSIGNSAFINRTNLTAITIPNSVTSIGSSAFQRCTSLTSITVPNSVTSIGDWAFSDCTNLASVTIGNGVTSIGDLAFSGTNLTAITIPASVTSIGTSTFSDCTGLTSITVVANNQNYSSQNGILYNKIGTTLIQAPEAIRGSLTIPNSVTSIGDRAFYNCTGLTSITIPNSVTSIGDTAFLGCTSLTSIIVNANSQNYSSQNGILYNKAVTILIQAPGAIRGNLTIPSSVTSIYNYAFLNCAGLTDVTIPSNVISIGEGAFGNCTGITSITIPNSVTTISRQAFYGCTRLTSVIFQRSNTGLESGSYSSFPGDLRDKYRAGGIGTYTRPNGTSETWTKQ